MFKKRNGFIFFVVILAFFVIYGVSSLGKLVEDKIAVFVYDEVNKVSKMLIREILDESFFNGLNIDSLFVVERNSAGEVELINFDTGKLNDVLGRINDRIIYYFEEFDNGNVEAIYGDLGIFKKYKINGDDGIYLDVPLGIVFSNPIISNIGPKVPIKIVFSGQVESDIETSIKQYGFNSALLEIDVKIRVVEKVIFPFSSQYVDVVLNLPLVIELISGKVAYNYLNSWKSDILE